MMKNKSVIKIQLLQKAGEKYGEIEMRKKNVYAIPRGSNILVIDVLERENKSVEETVIKIK